MARRSKNRGSHHCGTVLITGGSRGIGLELAKQFGQNGHDLVLVAREGIALGRAARQLQADHGCRVQTIAIDLADDGAPEDLMHRVQALGLQIDILVNNAGSADFGPFADADPAKLSAMLHLNILCLSMLTRRLLPGMLERGSGRILNVASVVAFFAGAAHWAAYLASKQYVLALTRGLRRELRDTGVSVTALCPGPTATAFAVNSGVSDTGAYRWLPNVHPITVARAAYRGTMSGRAHVVPGWLNRINAFLGELPPRVVAQAILSSLLGVQRGARPREDRRGALANRTEGRPE